MHAAIDHQVTCANPFGCYSILMDEDDLYFILRKGDVWTGWLSGKPAVRLSSKEEFIAAIGQFKETLQPVKSEVVKSIQPTLKKAEPEPSKVHVDRSEDRHDLTVLGRVYASGGSREVTILDLSENGCRFYDNSKMLGLGHHITVKIGHVGPVEAAVRWRREGFVGVRFSTPLYPSVLDHIRANLDFHKS